MTASNPSRHSLGPAPGSCAASTSDEYLRAIAGLVFVGASVSSFLVGNVLSSETAGVSIALLGILAYSALGRQPSAGLACAATLLALATFGCVLYGTYNRTSTGLPTGTGILPSLAPGDEAFAIRSFIVAALGVAAGANLRRVLPHRVSVGRGSFDKLLESAGEGRALLASALVLVVYVGAYGPKLLFVRDEYIVEPKIQILLVAASILLPFGLGLSMFAAALSEHRLRRVLSVALLTLYGVALFGSGSRSIALTPLAFLFVAVRRHHGYARAWRMVAWAVFLVVAVTSIPFSLRREHAHGIRPYAAAMLHDSSKLTYVDRSLVIDSVLVGYALTPALGSTVSSRLRARVAEEAFNPIPNAGHLGDQIAVANFQGAATFPASGIGVLSGSAPLLFAVALAIGMALAVFDSFLFAGSAWGISLAFGAGVALVFAQYQLRLTARIVELALLVALLAVFRLGRRRAALPRPTETELQSDFALTTRRRRVRRPN